MARFSTFTRISAAATPTVVYTAPAGGARELYLQIVANATTNLGRVKVEINTGSDRTFVYVGVPDTTGIGAGDPYWSNGVSMSGVVFASGNTVKITTPQSIDFDILVMGDQG